MSHVIRFALRALATWEAPAASLCIALVLICVFASGLRAGIVPNSDGMHADNGANDPYTVNAGASLTYINVFDDDVLLVNGGKISNQSRPAGFWRSPIRLFDQSQAIINGGLIQDFDPQISTWALDLNDHSRLTVNGGTFRQSGVGASALLRASDNSFATINGGDFHSVDNPAVTTSTFGSVTINGGTFASDEDDVVEVRSVGLVTIQGGTFSGPDAGVIVRGGSLVLRGGLFDTDLDLNITGGGAQLVARSASIGGVPLVEGVIASAGGVIDLVWPEGAAASLQFQREVGSLSLKLVPEPSTLTLVTVVLLGSLMRRQPHR